MTDITREQLSATKPGGFKAADYNAVAGAAILSAVELLHLKADVHPEIVVDGARLSYGRELTSCDHDKLTNSAAAIFRFYVKAKKGRKLAFMIEADYIVAYDVGEGAHENAAIAFVNNVGLFAAYPYFRALVSQIGWNMGLNLPSMPSIASTAYKSALKVPNSD